MVDPLILTIILGLIALGLATWLRDYISADEKIHRLRVRAIDRGILEKAFEIVNTLGTGNRYQKDHLAIEFQGENEKLSEREFTGTSRLHRLAVRNGEVIVFEVSSSPTVTEHWTRDILGYIPGPWEKKLDGLYKEAVAKKLEKAQDHWKEQRKRFGIQ